MDNSPVKFEANGAVFEIILNRPNRLNAMNMEFFHEFTKILDQAAAPEFRAVIVRGEGKLFCVGGDIQIFAEVAKSGMIIPESAPDLLHESITKIRNLQKPVIAVVHGACAGAGLSLALACDLVIAAAGTRFNLAYVGIGLSPDGGSTHFLPRHVGLKKAMEIFLTGKTFMAEEALEMGIINRIVDATEVLEQGRMMAQMLAMGPTQAYGRLKKLLGQTFDNTLEQQLRQESIHFSASSATADFRAGVNGFLKKEQPVFEGK